MFERREGEPLNLKQLWSAALGEIQLNLSKGNYDTWFKDTAIVSEEDDVFMVGVPNAFAREWLENKYRTQVRETLQRLLSRTVDVRFVNMTAASARSDRPVASVPNGGMAPASTSSGNSQERPRDNALGALLFLLRFVRRRGNVQVAGRRDSAGTYVNRLDVSRVPHNLHQGMST